MEEISVILISIGVFLVSLRTVVAWDRIISVTVHYIFIKMINKEPIILKFSKKNIKTHAQELRPP